MAGGIQDLWVKQDGTPSARHGRGLRYRVRYLGQTKSFRTKTAAERYWRDITADDAVRPSGVTVGDLLDAWKAGKRGLSPRGYRACVDAAAVCSPLAGRRAQDVTRPELQQWIADLTVTVRQRRDGETVTVTRPASASTRQKARRALHGAFQIGVDRGELAMNPAAKLRVSAEQLRDPVFLSAHELQAVAERAGHHRPLILLLGTTGLRIGEACALNVGDVNVKRRRLWVRGAVAKTRRGREVPIPASVLGLLDLDRAADAPLFTTPSGTRVERHNLSRRVWRPIAPSGMRLHDLRHTAASLAIASGADVKVVQRMLGHASAAMTLDRYGHLWDHGLDDVASRMDDLIRVPGASD